MNRNPLAGGLLTNYAKMGWRSLIKNKFTSMVNITGLVAGLTSSFFIGLFILDELAYDRHFKNHERIYRVTSSYDKDGHLYHSAQTRGDVAEKLWNEIPEVRAITRLMPLDEAFIFTDKGVFKENIIYTDSSFLTVFGLDLLKGNKSKCLAGPSSIIISERTALKFFGNDWSQQQVLGKIVPLDGRIPMAITGVFKAFPGDIHFHSDLFASVPSGFESWMDENVYTYALLDEKVDENDVSRKLQDLSAHFFADQDQIPATLVLQRLSDIYLFSSLEDENARQGNVQNIIALCLVSLFLIVITIVNFVNLYTAGSLGRVKEVGVRKTLGALQWQLRVQFFGETAIVAFIAIGLSFLLAMLLLPAFNQLTGKELLTSSLFNNQALQLMGALTLIIAVLAGSYPAIFLSGKNTIESLKKTRNTGRRSPGIREGLIVLQFSLSCIMIILSYVAFQQVDLISEKDLGFDRSNTLAIANPYMLGSTENILAFRQELLKVPGVEDISVTGYTPSQNRWENDRITFPDRIELSPQRQHATWIMVDENFIRTMGMRLIEGRNFVENHEHYKNVVIINETAAAQFGLNANGKSAVGSELSYHEGGNETPEHFKVIGIVADFNFGSLHEKIKPVIMKPGFHRFEMVMRLSPHQRPTEILKGVESIWKKNLPLIPFQYSFIQTRFEKLHKSDMVASQLFSILCVLTIVMSALGLFSMVTYSVANRTKELGIRKLLGASGSTITLLVAVNFLRLIFLAYVLAVPFAWFMASRWVSNFAYKTEITWWVFALTGFILLGISLMTLSYQTLKAARTNPVDHLRHE